MVDMSLFSKFSSCISHNDNKLNNAEEIWKQSETGSDAPFTSIDNMESNIRLGMFQLTILTLLRTSVQLKKIRGGILAASAEDAQLTICKNHFSREGLAQK